MQVLTRLWNAAWLKLNSGSTQRPLPPIDFARRRLLQTQVLTQPVTIIRIAKPHAPLAYVEKALVHEC